MEILRDSLWQFVGVVLALVALFVTIYFSKRQQPKKILSYEIISSTSLFSQKTEHQEKLEVYFAGALIPGAHLIVVKLFNSGNIPVASEDYEIPISFEFNGNNKVLDANVASTKPTRIKASLSIEQNNVVLKPVLLNPGDVIAINIFLTNFDGKIRAEGRIIGVKEITQIPSYIGGDTAFDVIMMAIVIAFFVFLMLIAFLVLDYFFDFPVTSSQYNPMIAVIAYTIFLAWFYRVAKNKNESKVN